MVKPQTPTSTSANVVRLPALRLEPSAAPAGSQTPRHISFNLRTSQNFPTDARDAPQIRARSWRVGIFETCERLGECEIADARIVCRDSNSRKEECNACMCANYDGRPEPVCEGCGGSTDYSGGNPATPTPTPALTPTPPGGIVTIDVVSENGAQSFSPNPATLPPARWSSGTTSTASPTGWS